MVGFETSSARVTIPRIQSVVCVTLVCSAVACSLVIPPTSSARIITKYAAAACIPFSANPKVSPHTREWDSVLTLGDGTEVIVKGAQIPGGRITVSYPATNQDIVAADPGDYVYPSDVRLDPRNDLLYVKAYGLAGGLSEQTWLFEYDFRRQRIMERRQVRNGILPIECPEPSHSQ